MRLFSIVVPLTLLVALLGTFARTVTAQTATTSKMALITIRASVEIEAPIDNVWAAITQTDLAHAWYPGWKNAQGATSLNRVGNTIRFDDGYGNSGLSVVLYVDPGAELRVAHAPDNGSYICEVKFKLSQRPGKIIVEVTEQYSDDLAVPIDKDTAQMTKQEIEGYLGVLKTLSEGGSPVGDASATPLLLDGRVYVGEIGEHGMVAFASEELMFDNGKFRSSHADKYQFGQSNYSAENRNNAIAFSAETLSPSDGRMRWKGNVSNGHLEATIEWHDKGGKLIKNYWVKATLKTE